MRIGMGAITVAVFTLAGCNSLLDEAERIRTAYGLKNSEAPTVVSTDPADGATGPYGQTYIDLHFSTALDVATATVQGAGGACSGSLQFSTDNFSTCIGGSLDAAANPRLRFTPVVMPLGAIIRIRTTPPLAGTYGKPALDYYSPLGVSFGTPCGASNCFFSTSLPLLTNAGASSAIFRIRSGAHQGKLLVITEGQTATTMVDFTALATTAGPPLPTAPSAGLHTFPVTQGPDNGKEMVLVGGTTTYLYNPATHSFDAGPAPAGINAGAFSFSPPAGAQSGKVFTINGAPTTTVNAYPDNLGNFTDGATITGPSLPGPGAHALRLSAGTAASYIFLVFGNNTAQSRFFDESTGSIIAGPTLAGNAAGGSSSFVVRSGPLANRIVTVLGNNTNTTNLYNISITTNEGAGPTLTGNVTAGGLLLYRYGTALADEPLVLHGGGFTTDWFRSSTGTFSSGPLTHGHMSNGSSTLYIPSTSTQGHFYIVNGSGLTNTQIYSVSNRAFVGNTLPGSTPNVGAHAVYINTGIHSGRTLVIAAGTRRHTAFYDPTSHGCYQGPLTVNPITPSGFSVPITSGPYAGRIAVFAGGGSNTYDVYNPNTGVFQASADIGFAIGGTPPLPTNNGASAFEMNDGRILIINGGGGTTTQILDPVSYTFVTSATPATACGVTMPYNLRYTRPSDGRAMQLVWCNGSTFTIFDHVTQTFSASSGLGGGVGLQAFVIPSGPEQGHIALVHGGGTTTWSIQSAEDFSAIGGVRSLAGCSAVGVGQGSQLIPIQSGSNSGRHLLVIGNNSRNTCLFDPQTLSFSAGPAVGNVASPGYNITAGSVAFATRGGQYPTGTVLLSGGGKNIWSTYVP